MTKLIISAMSDLHGILPEMIEPADILLIAGDILPINIQFNKPESKNWLHTTFIEWINSLPVDEVFFTPGNHDAYFEGISDLKLVKLMQDSGWKLHILINELGYYNGLVERSITIFGTPYCPEFGHWPFMRSDLCLEQKFLDIPMECDIIISHSPPYNIDDCDLIMKPLGGWSSIHAGSKVLTKALINKSYKLLVCGHIHTGSHILKNKCVNVSLVDETYTKAYPIFYTQIQID